MRLTARVLILSVLMGSLLCASHEGRAASPMNTDHQSELLDSDQVGAKAYDPDHQAELLDSSQATPYPHEAKPHGTAVHKPINKTSNQAPRAPTPETSTQQEVAPVTSLPGEMAPPAPASSYVH